MSAGRQQYKKGMTLVEVIVVSTIFSVVMAVLTLSISSLYRTNAYTMAQASEVYNARHGVQIMVRDIREMTFADDGTFPLARMEDNLVGFYSDIDRDDSVEYIEYELATTTTLTKRVYNASGSPVSYDTSMPDETIILSDYVQNLNQATSTFYYFDTAGNPATATTSVTDISYIQVKVIVNIDPVRDPGQFMLRGSAALRNVIDNI